MWLYMMSFYMDASWETKRRRLPYLCASFIVLALFLASSVVTAVTVYQSLLEAVPGPENIEYTMAVLSKEQNRLFISVSSLLADLAYRVSDVVLVSPIHS